MFTLINEKMERIFENKPLVDNNDKHINENKKRYRTVLAHPSPLS